MKTNKRIIFTLTLIILLITFPMVSFAHSGKTDSRGGHRDNKNKSGLGSYHYHHGMSAHLHPNGVCPYSGASTQTSNTVKSTPSPSIKVSNLSTTMNIGDISGFDAKIENTSNTNINVTSSNTEVISVNPDKTLSAKGAGTSIVTIGNDAVSKSFTITVKEVFATDLEISTNISKLQIDETLKIKANIMPNNTTNKNLTYESSDESIAIVSSDGTIRGISSGEVTIKVSTSNGLSKNLDIAIFEIFPDTIECDESINLIVGDSQDFKINILPENSNNKNFTVSCDNEKILKYSENKITAIKEGETSLIIETWNGVKKTIPVKVDIIPVEAIEIIDSTKYILSNVIDLSDEILLSTKISPSNSTYQNVIWNSSNLNVINIENNEFVVKGIGKTTLTCNTHNNIVDSIQIIVIDKNLILLISSCGTIIIICSVVFITKHKKK